MLQLHGHGPRGDGQPGPALPLQDVTHSGPRGAACGALLGDAVRVLSRQVASTISLSSPASVLPVVISAPYGIASKFFPFIFFVKLRISARERLKIFPLISKMPNITEQGCACFRSIKMSIPPPPLFLKLFISPYRCTMIFTPYAHFFCLGLYFPSSLDRSFFFKICFFFSCSFPLFPANDIGSYFPRTDWGKGSSCFYFI